MTTLQPLHQFQEIIEAPTFTAGDAFANSLSWPPPSVIVPTYFFQLSPSTFFQCLYNHRYEAGKEIGKKKCEVTQFPSDKSTTKREVEGILVAAI